MFTTDLVNLYNRNIFRTSLYIYIVQDEKCRLMRNLSLSMVAPASPIECLLYLPNVRAKQYKLGPERLTWLGNSNVLRLPVYLMKCKIDSNSNLEMKKTGVFRSLALQFLWYELKLFKGEKVFFFTKTFIYLVFF